MGESQEQEQKKMEEKEKEKEKEKNHPEEPKTDDKNSDHSKDAPPPPPPPQEIILRVYMHCEGCAEKIRRCLKGFVGVEDVQTDCKTHKVVVKGEKADPLKVLERVQKKSHRQVELLSPIPKPPAADESVKKIDERKTPSAEEPKLAITVILKVHMHCEACAQEIKRRILKMKGVAKVDADLKSSQVTVNGTFDPPKLLEYVYKRTGKQAVIVKQEPEKKEEVEKAKEETKLDGGEKSAPEEKEKKGEVDAVVAPPLSPEGEGEKEKVVEAKKNEVYSYSNINNNSNNNPMNFQIYPPRFATEMYAQGYAPQMFSDENPNACSVM